MNGVVVKGVVTEKDYPIRGLWILKSVFRSLLSWVAFAFIFGTTFTGSPDPEVRKEVLTYFSLLIIFSVLQTIFSILRRATFHYSIEEQFLTLRQGILSRQQRHIPYGVIQNLFVKQSLFDRIFRLASLTIENASSGGGVLIAPLGNQPQGQVDIVGYSGNKISIPGLTKGDAESLKSIILLKMKENPVEDNQSGL